MDPNSRPGKYQPPAEDSKPSCPKPFLNSSKRVLRWIPKISPAVKGPPAQADSVPPLSPKSVANLNLNHQGLHVRPSGSYGPSAEPLRLPPLCSRCLGPGHSTKECGNLVRCRTCYNYGHMSVSCLSKSRHTLKFRPVSIPEGEGATPSSFKSVEQLLDASVATPPPLPATPTVKNLNSSAMANWACDPRPHVPKGFTLVELLQRPPLRHEVYVTGLHPAQRGLGDRQVASCSPQGRLQEPRDSTALLLSRNPSGETHGDLTLSSRRSLHRFQEST